MYFVFFKHAYGPVTSPENQQLKFMCLPKSHESFSCCLADAINFWVTSIKTVHKQTLRLQNKFNFITIKNISRTSILNCPNYFFNIPLNFKPKSFCLSGKTPVFSFIRSLRYLTVSDGDKCSIGYSLPLHLTMTQMSLASSLAAMLLITVRERLGKVIPSSSTQRYATKNTRANILQFGVVSKSIQPAG